MQAEESLLTLTNPEPKKEDLEKLVSARVTKEKLVTFLLKNKVKIFEAMKNASDCAIQFQVMKMIRRALTVNEVKEQKIFQEYSEKYTTNIEIFITAFNHHYNPNIVSCLFSKMHCPEKNLTITKGAIFIDKTSLKLYSGRDIVILCNENMEEITIVEDSRVKVVAKEKKNVEIFLVTNNDFYNTFMNKLKAVYESKIAKPVLAIKDQEKAANIKISQEHKPNTITEKLFSTEEEHEKSNRKTIYKKRKKPKFVEKHKKNRRFSKKFKNGRLKTFHTVYFRRKKIFRSRTEKKIIELLKSKEKIIDKEYRRKKKELREEKERVKSLVNKRVILYRKK